MEAAAALLQCIRARQRAPHVTPKPNRASCKRGGEVQCIEQLTLALYSAPHQQVRIQVILACDSTGECEDVLRELLALTGTRAIPLQARREAGELATRAAQDAVWSGTSTRQGRARMLLLRVQKAK